MCETRTPPSPLGEYHPRDAAGTVLYAALAGSLETFLARARERDRIVPRFVERELIERLAVLVPPPRFHLVRYYGILAPRASWRDEVVPAPLMAGATREGAGHGGPGPAPLAQSATAGAPGDTSPQALGGRRLPWAQLLARVLELIPDYT